MDNNMFNDLKIEQTWNKWRTDVPRGATFIKNQKPHAIATYSTNLLYTRFFCCNIKQYMHNFNDKITIDNVYT